jgi:hypothetical protein
LEDVFGEDMKDVTGTEDMAGVADMMTGVKGATGTEDVTRVNGTTGEENGAETTKNGIRHAEGKE